MAPVAWSNANLMQTPSRAVQELQRESGIGREKLSGKNRSCHSKVSTATAECVCVAEE